MGDIIDMAARRQLPEAVVEVPAEPTHPFGDIAAGLDLVARHAAVPARLSSRLHDGYDLHAAQVPPHTFPAGEKGVTDFYRSFRAIYKRAGHDPNCSQTLRTAHTAYGIYGAAGHLLERIIAGSEERRSFLQFLLDQAPDTSPEEARHNLICRAAATMALLGISNQLDTATKVVLVSAIRKGKFTSRSDTSRHFKDHMPVDIFATLAGLR